MSQVIGRHVKAAQKLPVTLAYKINPGDTVLDHGNEVFVRTVQKARGRKPQTGENLVFLTDRGQITINSLSPVRVRRADG